MAKKKRSNREEMPLRARVDANRIERMLAVCIQNPDVFAKVREHLNADTLRQVAVYYPLVWNTACAYFNEHGHLPDYGEMEQDIQTAIVADDSMFDDDEVESLNTFIGWAYDPDTFSRGVTSDETYAETALATLRQWLEEQIERERADLTAESPGMPKNMPALLHTFDERHERVATLTTKGSGETPYKDPFVGDWTEDVDTPVWSTGVDFFNRFLGGGQAPGEVYGLLGPYGSCKTTLICQLACEAAKTFAAEAEAPDWNGVHKVAYIISYEATFRELRMRTLGYTARIARSSMDAMRGEFKRLSVSSNLRPYERKMFAREIQAGNRVLGEQLRAKRAVRFLNRHLGFFDLTGGKDSPPNAGVGGINEIAYHIKRDLKRRGNSVCGWIGIDYTGTMIRKQMMASEIPNTELRHLITHAPYETKVRLAEPYSSPVWLLHQLSGQANAKGTTAALDHTDAAESKSFGENVDFSFIVTKPNHDQMGICYCTKHRRQKAREAEVIRINGNMNRVESTNGHYVIDPTSRAIISRGERNSIQSTQGQSTSLDRPSNEVAEAADAYE